MDKLSLMPTYHPLQICHVMPKLAHKSPFRQELRGLPADHRDVNDKKKHLVSVPTLDRIDVQSVSLVMTIFAYGY